MRIGVNGGSLNQELVMRKMQENTDRDLGFTSEEIINECMVISALESTELALECGLRNDQIIISCKTSRPLDLITSLSRSFREDGAAAAPGLDGSGHGIEGVGVVVRGDGDFAARWNRRHDSDFVDAETRRRSARRSLRGVRIAAGAGAAQFCAECYGVSRMRAHDKRNISGVGGKYSGIHPRANADVEEAI